MRHLAAHKFAPNLADLLFGAYRRDVLGLLLLHPGESYHVRELARMTARPANTLYRELATLAAAGVLLRRNQGNQVHYAANPACPIYEELRGILRKTTGIAEILRKALDAYTEQIKLAFVYGSVASGQEGPRSDIDVLIVGDLAFADAVRAFASAERSLQREINPRVYGLREFQTKLTGKESFLIRVLSGPTLWLIGSLDDAAKSGRNRTTKAA